MYLFVCVRLIYLQLQLRTNKKLRVFNYIGFVNLDPKSDERKRERGREREIIVFIRRTNCIIWLMAKLCIEPIYRFQNKINVRAQCLHYNHKHTLKHNLCRLNISSASIWNTSSYRFKHLFPIYSAQ